MLDCPNLAVPAEIMQHVVSVESSHNPFAIGVVGGRLVRQPRNLQEAIATAEMLRQKGYNYSVGLAQVNKNNFERYRINTHSQAFDRCQNLQAGSRILRECYERSGKDWGKAFSCYYSGNFVTGFKHGYVQKIMASLKKAQQTQVGQAQLNNMAAVVATQANKVSNNANTVRSNRQAVIPQANNMAVSLNPVAGVKLPPANGKGGTDWFGIPTPVAVLSQYNGANGATPAPVQNEQVQVQNNLNIKKQEAAQKDPAFVF